MGGLCANRSPRKKSTPQFIYDAMMIATLNSDNSRLHRNAQRGASATVTWLVPCQHTNRRQRRMHQVTTVGGHIDGEPVQRNPHRGAPALRSTRCDKGAGELGRRAGLLHTHAHIRGTGTAHNDNSCARDERCLGRNRENKVETHLSPAPSTCAPATLVTTRRRTLHAASAQLREARCRGQHPPPHHHHHHACVHRAVR